MDQYTRRIVGFGVHAGTLDGIAVCRMFNAAIRGQVLPRFLSTDHDPLFEFHRWRANLRVLDVEEIKTVPYVPLSHPFVERLIGTLRREYLDQVPFWGATDLQRKLSAFREFYNTHRAHDSLGGQTPVRRMDPTFGISVVGSYIRWYNEARIKISLGSRSPLEYRANLGYAT